MNMEDRKIARTKNTVRNIMFGSINRMINIIVPFVARTVILYVMGTQYLGLSSLFSSILSFLSLTELGVGAAMVFSMYKPIAKNDEETICALLNLYRKCYTVIGTVILVVGICLLPFLKILVPEQLPSDINLHLLYLIYLFNAVLSYWLFAYKNAVLQAFQRNDINSRISSVIIPLSYVIMLGALFLTKNYYAYVIWQPVFTILTNVLRMKYVDKHFPQYQPKGEVSREIKQSIIKKTAALVGTKLNTVVLNAADNIVMSAFLGLTVVTMYGNYYYIMSSVIGFLSIIYSSMTAGLGNSIATETVDKNYRDFQKFSYMNAWLVGWCSICLICLYQPFMQIWVGEDLMFSIAIVLQFSVYFYIYQLRKIPVVYKDAAGIWWEDRFRPYVCMIVNLISNVILVQCIGVSGILLSTILSLVISIPWENYTIFKYVFRRSSKEYYKKMFYYFGVTLLAGSVTWGLCSFWGNGLWSLGIRLIICIVVPNVIFIFATRRSWECKEAIKMIGHIMHIKL